MLLGVLIVGLAGTAVELLFLGHHESPAQWVPLGLIAAGLPVVLWDFAARTNTSVRVMRVMMAAFITAGVLGVALHYRGSLEFQKEVDPTLRGLTLFIKVMQAKAPPALAPGVLAHLGLVGLVYTYCQHR